MTKCEHGFTLSAEIKLMDLNSTDKRYIFSSGGDQVGASGLALYLWHGELYCATKKDNFMWTAKQKLNVKVGEWHTYQVSWNKKDGFVVYLDGKEFMSHSIKLPNPDQPTVYPLYIASAPNHTYSSTAMEVRNLFTWSASRDSLIGQGCITGNARAQLHSFWFCSNHGGKIIFDISLLSRIQHSCTSDNSFHSSNNDESTNNSATIIPNNHDAANDNNNSGYKHSSPHHSASTDNNRGQEWVNF